MNELTIGQAKELAGTLGWEQNETLPFELGMKIFARTVTYHVTGKIVAITGKWITLDTAAWIADSGRFAKAVESSKFDEVEPFSKRVFINTDSITDATEIDDLPGRQS